MLEMLRFELNKVNDTIIAKQAKLIESHVALDIKNNEIMKLKDEIIACLERQVLLLKDHAGIK